jgi:hypothetical protein
MIYATSWCEDMPTHACLCTQAIQCSTPKLLTPPPYSTLGRTHTPALNVSPSPQCIPLYLASFGLSGILASSFTGLHSLTNGKNSSCPGIYFCSTFGTLKPSGVWKFSRRQHSVRSVAVRVPLSAWTYSLRVDVCFLTPVGAAGLARGVWERRKGRGRRTEADFQLARLVVCAVGAGNELLVLAAAGDGEPGLEIALHRGRVVCTTN